MPSAPGVQPSCLSPGFTSSRISTTLETSSARDPGEELATEEHCLSRPVHSGFMPYKELLSLLPSMLGILKVHHIRVDRVMKTHDPLQGGVQPSSSEPKFPGLATIGF